MARGDGAAVWGCALIPLGTRLRQIRARAKVGSGHPRANAGAPGHNAGTATRFTESQMPSQGTRPTWARASRARGGVA